MTIHHGKVVDGKIELEGAALPEGTAVRVVVAEDWEAELSPEEIEELEDRLRSADAGNVVPWEEVLKELRD